MRCDVVAVGTELLLGQITDTNSQWIGEQLAAVGIDSLFQAKVGDNLGRITALLRRTLAEADAMGGFALYLQDGKLHFTYSLLGLKIDTLTSAADLPKGRTTVRYEFTADEPNKLGTGGQGKLFVNDQAVGENRLSNCVPLRSLSVFGPMARNPVAISRSAFTFGSSVLMRSPASCSFTNWSYGRSSFIAWITQSRYM